MRRWKQTLLCSLLALLLGFGGGFTLRHLLSPRSTAALSAVVSSPATQAQGTTEGDSISLIRCALETIDAIRQSDYRQLASYIHPDNGVTFTPTATVDLSSNLTFQADELIQAAASGKTYLWGTSPSSAAPIQLTLADYLSSYVWDRDYAAAPRISVDTEQISGNALNNILDVYPDCHYVEFYCPAASGQSDWSSLKLVYQWHQNNWYLVGIAHSAWSP